MRLLLRGGVWKNTEDEILKAAVMKYGVNQWARISSLLVRKSAKQCKARWYEWLDPKIKKTPWSREEDEKLLHLAKIMPTQWRTIAPIVGRTAAQCLTRYEQLLDEAQDKDADYDKARQLPVGEIDPHPEDKPAQPDPVDMDEDEKEMLSEARARLANTKGKKAKRKAREKQLEQARRLASLQKIRELRAAGIHVGRKRRKRPQHIVAGEEIPFPRQVPAGFYDTTRDDAKSRKMQADARKSFKPMSIEDLEGERRDDKERRLRKEDKKRQKLLEQDNLPDAFKRVNLINDPQTIRHRKDMMLPTPQVTDAELDMIRKFNEQPVDGGDGVTATLVAGINQGQQLQSTPSIRTPSAQDHLRKEIENAVARKNVQTPLLGGENPNLHDSDFTGANAKTTTVSTPNPLATPMTSAGGMTTPGFGGRTPGTPGLGGALTPGKTPMRDGLSINRPATPGGPGTPSMTKRQLRKQRRKMRGRLKEGLMNLPAVQNEYIISLPQVPDDLPDESEFVIEDAAEIDRRYAAEAEAAKHAEFKRRSQVLQRGMPRPRTTNVQMDPHQDENRQDWAMAAKQLNNEMLKMIRYDNLIFPEGKQPKKKRKIKRDQFTDEQLANARKLLKEEIKTVQKLRGVKTDPKKEREEFEDFCNKLLNSNDQVMFVPSRGKYDFTQVVNYEDKLQARQQSFGVLQHHVNMLSTKNSKQLNKQNIMTKGYRMKTDQYKKRLHECEKDCSQTAINIEIFEYLHSNESAAIPRRTTELEKLVKREREREAELQEKYRNLLEEAEILEHVLATTKT